MTLKTQLEREIKLELARRDLWYFCHLLYPDFYKPKRQYLKDLCKIIQSRPKKLMINMPPRTGKSLTLTLAETWFLGHNNNEKIISVSYNETLSGRFSKGVRNTIEATRQDENMFVFQDVFPTTKIKRGDASASLWSLENSYFSYIGAGVGSSITGLGASLLVVDDIIKSAKEAYTNNVIEGHYDFYRNTLLSRLESGGTQIINMTRWCEDDLCGRLIKDDPDWIIYSIKMEQKNGEPLCEELMTKDEMESKKLTMSEDIWFANYQQEILISENNLYKIGFKLFDQFNEVDKRTIIMDVADKGSDFLSALSFVNNGDFKDVHGVFLDKTELADIEERLLLWILKQNPNIIWVEANNVGNYFSRNLKKRLDGQGIVVKTYTTVSNKEGRIKAGSWWIQEYVRFHKSLKNSDFVKQLVSFKQQFNANKHDDAPDVCTAIYDIFGKSSTFKAGIRI